ncbi:hypothetical protein ASD64_16210 [Mesorhizobium sp. Root157]|uniref:DUF6163 family protein n=1 Tax=Mesorhizobium sp. Root157 TaxID=1736477 RepID=UPI0006FEE9E6|nr:DUF6163 family protein [Mesorhizobium sp. Root157]KQZ98508.1 hypothetical protein ASD64_16210 [Mesorhizobium sp. Root157]
MIDPVSKRAALQPTTAEVAFTWFMRIVGAYCLLFGVLYWIRLIGFYPGSLFRFDLMPVHWQVAASALAVLFPIAAAGLWMLASWAPVIWFLCAAAESAMYVGFPQYFGARPLIVFSHAAVALLYLALRLVMHLQKRQASH